MAVVLNLEPLGYSEEAENIIGPSYVAGNPTLLHVLRPDVIITRLAYNITGEIMDEAANLRAIVSATTGLDHIDLDAARDRGIEVLSLQGEAEFLRTIPATAEHTWALLLALLRRIPWAFEDVKAGNWNRDAWRGSNLTGKRITVLGGEGRVGSQVRGYATAFGMKVISADKRFALGDTDILTIHVPLNENTRDMISYDELPRTRILINTSRAEIVNQHAMFVGLLTGRLEGAATDVIPNEREGRVATSLLEYARHHDNLLITPHIGGATHEAMEATEIFCARKLVAWLKQNA